MERMKFWKILPLAIIAALGALQACNKSSDDSTKASLTGSLSIDIPTYVEAGYSKSFMIDTLMTLSRSDGGVVGYYIQDAVTGLKDTLYTADGEWMSHYFTVTAPDTLATLSFVIGGFAAEGYYSSSVTSYFTVVKTGVGEDKSISNFDIKSSDQQFTDERDGRKYYYANVEGTDWMRQNLAWTGAGRSYSDCEVMSTIFGQYYTWTEAQTACPAGWRLPDDDDWLALGRKYGTDAKAGSDLHALAGDLMEDLYFNGTKMWEFWPTVKVTNSARLSVMPTGYATIVDGQYTADGLYSYAAFWTSQDSGDLGFYRYFYVDKDDVFYGAAPKDSFAAPVRCVKK